LKVRASGDAKIVARSRLSEGAKANEKKQTKKNKKKGK